MNLPRFILVEENSNQNTTEHETCLFGDLQLFKLLITTHVNMSSYNFTKCVNCELFTCMCTVQKNMLMDYVCGSYVNIFSLDNRDIKTHKYKVTTKHTYTKDS